MNAELHLLELLPRTGGWTSGRRRFGSFLTFVTGENGAGKTPMMKAIAFALGHPLKLTDQIKAHCHSIRLTLRIDGRDVAVERRADDEERRFFASITDRADRHEFESEPDFTTGLLPFLGIPTRPLASKKPGNIITKPYASILTPVYWLDQDRGWHVPYSPLHTKNFVKDQGTEATRWVLGVAQHNLALDRRDQVRLQSEIEKVDSLIRGRNAAITQLRAELDDTAVEELQEAKRRIVAELGSEAGVLESVNSAEEAIGDELRAVVLQLEQARRRHAALARDKRNLDAAVREIEAEEQVLLANENAADLFRRACGNVHCGFFKQPSESYGRRLLFVKDQLKDLRSASSAVEAEIARVQTSIVESDDVLRELNHLYKVARKATASEKLVAKIDALSTQLQKVTIQLVRHDHVIKEERRLSQLIERKHQLRHALDQFTSSRRGRDEHTSVVKSAFGASVMRWLDTLKTPNLEQVAVNDNFEITVNGRRFNYDSSESGSTRTRFVLAYHAALLETSMTHGGCHPRWLVCDAPRQQEIKLEDIHCWVEALRALSKKHPFQLVLSGKDNFATIDPMTDELWRPTYQMNQAFLQHLGPAEPPSSDER